MNDLNVNSFIKTDHIIYDLLTKQGFQDYSNTSIDVYCWLLNDLATSIMKGDDITTRYNATYTKADTSKMIKYDVINEKNKRTTDLVNNSIKTVKDILFNTSFRMQIVSDNVATQLFLFSYVSYNNKTEELTVGYNPYFLEYFKEICEQKSFNKLKLDIMTSLTTLSTKYVWMYISEYTKQLHTKGSTHWTNIESEGSLPMLIADIKKGEEFRIWNIVKTIETAVDSINNLIILKNERYELNEPTYKIEWKREQDKISKTGKNRGKYKQYRIKEIKSKKKSKNTPNNTPKTKSHQSNTIIEDKDWKAWG